MPDQTAEEAKEAHIAAMGEPLGSMYSALWQETAKLYFRWSEYLVLFGAKPSRIELMNNTSPRFFRIVQDVMFEAIVLHVARMMDPPKTAGKENLSLQALKDVVPEADHEIRELVDKAVAATEEIKEWRHRVLAHYDRTLALDENAGPVPGISRQSLQGTIDSIVAVVNAVSKRYLNSESAFRLGVGPGGAEALLYVMDDGLRLEAERQERLKAGEYREEDWVPRDL